ncbi:alpha/beta fold hydrolase [Herbidospora sp. RD11066]
MVTPDGKRLGVQDKGPPSGKPVFLLHGTPGSRFVPAPEVSELRRDGIRLITFDRPGYGVSDSREGRTVADAAADVKVIADALGIDRFAVAGRSGGGPHALACAALLPARTTRAASLVSLAPPDAVGLDWFRGMTESNVRAFKTAEKGRDAVADSLRPAARKIQRDPASKIQGLLQESPESDRRTVSDADIRRMLLRNFAEAFRGSADGWIDDVVAFSSDWSFDPGQIKVPTMIWHGEKDVYSPVAHAEWLGCRIPGATLRIDSGVAHFGAIEVLPEVLNWLTRD